MKKEDLIKLGLDDEAATKVADAFGDYLKGFIPKQRFDEVNTQKNEYQSKIEELSQSTGSVEELKQQIEATKAEMTTKEAEYQQRIKDITLDSALKLSISGKVHDADIVASLLKGEGLELDENGAVKGLDEKVEALQESKPFLFKAKEEGKPANPFQFQGKIGNDKKTHEPTPPADTFASAIAEAMSNINN